MQPGNWSSVRSAWWCNCKCEQHTALFTMEPELGRLEGLICRTAGARRRWSGSPGGVSGGPEPGQAPAAALALSWSEAEWLQIPGCSVHVHAGFPLWFWICRGLERTGARVRECVSIFFGQRDMAVGNDAGGDALAGSVESCGAKSDDCPPPLRADNVDLGTACGKYFRVASLSITDPGDSDIIRTQPGEA